MVEAKVRLSFEVPGAQMLSSQECEQNPKENYNYQTIAVKVKNSKKKPAHTELLKVKTRKSKSAKQAITISKEAYEYMVSADGKPEQTDNKLTKARWSQLTKKQRLDVHMRQIAEALGGFNPVYEILED